MKKTITVPFHKYNKNGLGNYRFIVTDVKTNEEHVIYCPMEIQRKIYAGYVPFQKLISVVVFKLDGETIVSFERKGDIDYTIKVYERDIEAKQKFVDSLKKEKRGNTAALFIES